MAPGGGNDKDRGTQARAGPATVVLFLALVSWGSRASAQPPWRRAISRLVEQFF